MTGLTSSTAHGSSNRFCRDRLVTSYRAGLMLLMAGMAGTWMSFIPLQTAQAARLSAGVAKADITDREAGPVNDPLYAKALVLKSGNTTAALITLDAVAIGEIGYIKNDFFPKLRARLQNELGIPPSNVLVNASHCHGVVCKEVGERAFQAVKTALQHQVPVTVGTGVGREDRMMINRRIKLKNGKEADIRHAYSLPPDEEIAAVGPVDPEIGVLRLDRDDGRTLAVVYNFACHPIQGVPSRGNTADIIGFASGVIEDNTSEGTVALFVQGCGGDINPIVYKDVNHPRNAETLGNLLGLSTLHALRNIETRNDDRLRVLNETIALPRADLADRIAEMQTERTKLVESLTGTSLNFKTFIPLFVKYNVSGEFPSYYAHLYLHENKMERDGWAKLDAENRRNMQQYIRNIHTMETLTRINTNLKLLQKHQAERIASGSSTIDVELVALRIGDFVLTTFPGELTVQIGLNIKSKSPFPTTFVAGYTNGYIYYCPTAEQLRNVGGAQEDSDCLLAPEWQSLYEHKALQMLSEL